MIKTFIAIALVVLGALAGVIVMALMQINRIVEPVGIVEDNAEEEEVLP